MKTLLWAFACLLAILPTVHSLEAQLLFTLPSCALQCLSKPIPNSPCSLSDFQCMCDSATFNDLLTDCVTKSCSVKESLTTANITAAMCNKPIRDRSRTVEVLSVSFAGAAILAVLLRILSRWYSTEVGLGWDDWTIIATVSVATVTSGITFAVAREGLGRDMWTIPFPNITKLFQLFYAMAIIYKLSSGLNKIAILCFYLRIFSTTAFRRVVYMLLAITGIGTVAFMLVDVLQCRPVSFFWTNWDGEHEGSCLNFNAVAWSHAGFNVFLDTIILLLPLHEIWKLSLPWKKKVVVGLMFSVGSFVTIITILRLQSLISFARTSNPSYDFFPITFWSILEIGIGIICVCMPALRVLLTKAIPGLKSTIAGSGKWGTSSVLSHRSRRFQQIGDDLSNKQSSHASVVQLSQRGGGDGFTDLEMR